jgi:hypothetical protein
MEATQRLGALLLIVNGFTEIVNLRPDRALRWKLDFHYCFNDCVRRETG